MLLSKTPVRILHARAALKTNGCNNLVHGAHARKDEAKKKKRKKCNPPRFTTVFPALLFVFGLIQFYARFTIFPFSIQISRSPS